MLCLEKKNIHSVREKRTLQVYILNKQIIQKNIKYYHKLSVLNTCLKTSSVKSVVHWQNLYQPIATCNTHQNDQHMNCTNHVKTYQITIASQIKVTDGVLYSLISLRM